MWRDGVKTLSIKRHSERVGGKMIRLTLGFRKSISSHSINIHVDSYYSLIKIVNVLDAGRAIPHRKWNWWVLFKSVRMFSFKMQNKYHNTGRVPRTYTVTSRNVTAALNFNPVTQAAKLFFRAADCRWHWDVSLCTLATELIQFSNAQPPVNSTSPRFFFFFF